MADNQTVSTVFWQKFREGNNKNVLISWLHEKFFTMQNIHDFILQIWFS